MQLNLRQRGFYGWEGMGDTVALDTSVGYDPITGALPAEPIDLISSPLPTTLTPTDAQIQADYAALLASSTPGTIAIGLCPDGSAPFSDGSCAETSAPANSQGALAAAAQIAAALAKGISPTLGTGGAPMCPAGYSYGAPGASVQIAPGVATVGQGKCLPVAGVAGASILPGVSNSSLALIGVALFAFLIISQSGGRRR